jgi:FkbM family methyltransferase
MTTKSTLTPTQLKKSKNLETRLRSTHRICKALHSLPFIGNFLSKFWSRAGLPELDDTLLCPTIFEFKLCVSKTTGGNYYNYGFYELGTLQVIDACLRPGDCFIDAGASVGQMSFVAAKKVGNDGRVLSFEPHPKRYEELLIGIDINDFRNVSAFNLGLGNRKDSLKLYVDLPSPSMVEPSHQSASFDVEIATLDSVLIDQPVSSIRMMKIDVEGYEGLVLLGASSLFSSTAPPIVCFEYGFYPHGREQDPVTILREFNDYRFFQLSGTKSRLGKLIEVAPNRFRPHDNVFCFLNDHINSVPSILFA